MAYGLPGRRFSLFVVPQVLTSLRHPERCVAESKDPAKFNDGFATGFESLASPRRHSGLRCNSTSLEMTKLTCVWRRSDWLPCNSSGNRIRTRAAMDWFVGRVRAAGADNVV